MGLVFPNSILNQKALPLKVKAEPFKFSFGREGRGRGGGGRKRGRGEAAGSITKSLPNRGLRREKFLIVRVGT